MAGAIDKKLADLGITLPTPAAPIANYVGSVRTSNLLVVSGQVCFSLDGKLAKAHTGKVGAEISAEAGKEAAKLAAIGVLAQVKAALGSLDKVARVVRLGGFARFQLGEGIEKQESDFAAEVAAAAGGQA